MCIDGAGRAARIYDAPTSHPRTLGATPFAPDPVSLSLQFQPDGFEGTVPLPRSRRIQDAHPPSPGVELIRPASSMAVTRAVASTVANMSLALTSSAVARPALTSSAASTNSSMERYPYPCWPANVPSVPGVYFMYSGLSCVDPATSVDMVYPRWPWSTRISPRWPM